MSLSGIDIVATALGVPVAAAVSARVALRRVIIAPLGVTRRVTPNAPQVWRLLVLAGGLGELTYFAIAGRPATTGGQTIAFTFGVIVTLIGLVMAGPWLTMTGARILARSANRPASLVAARRLGDNPQAGFRAISGLVVGLYVATVALAIIISLELGRGDPSAESSSGRATVVADLTTFTGRGPNATGQGAADEPGACRVRTSTGVRGAAALHDVRHGLRPAGRLATDWSSPAVRLARSPALGKCARGREHRRDRSIRRSVGPWDRGLQRRTWARPPRTR